VPHGKPVPFSSTLCQRANPGSNPSLMWIIKQKDKTYHCFSMKFILVCARQEYADIPKAWFSTGKSINKSICSLHSDKR
jgi:hypothetical protein